MYSILHIALPVAYFLFIIWLIGKWHFFKNTPFSTGALRFAFALKAFCGWVIYYLYTVYYPVRFEADTFKYFDDSAILFHALKEKPMDYFQMLFGVNSEEPYFYENYFNHMNNWVRMYENSLYNDNRLVIRINAFIRLFSLGNYHVHSLVFCFLSFTGLTALSKVFYSFLKSKTKVFAAVFLIPSVVFWSSGVLKEGVLLFALGFFVWTLYRLMYSKVAVLSAVVLVLCAWVLLIMKVYVFAAFIPAVIGWWWSGKTRHVLAVYLFSVVLVVAAAFSVGYLVPKYDFVQLMVNKQNDFVNMSREYQINSAIPMELLTPDWVSFSKAIPKAFVNSFSRPWITELKSPLFIPPFVENTGMLLLAVLALRFRLKLSSDARRFLLFGLVFTLLLFGIIGLTTPVIGALVRYKIPALPFLAAILLMLIDMNRLPLTIKNNRFLSWIKLHL